MAEALDGKVAIVTGASSGIGRAVAQELLRRMAGPIGKLKQDGCGFRVGEVCPVAGGCLDYAALWLP